MTLFPTLDLGDYSGYTDYMFIVEVLPLARGTSVGALTYYCSEELMVGTLVNIPLRQREVLGLVVDQKPVSAAKAALRAATFSLRKLAPQEKKITLPDELMQIAQKLSERYPAQMGAILFALLPPDIRTGVRKLPNSESRKSSNTEYATTVLTALTKERYGTYRSLIRQSFASGSSTLVVVPHSVYVEEAKKALSKGIEKRVITFSNTATKSNLTSAYKAFADTSEPKLIITTPAYAFLPRHDLGQIIIDRSGSPYYVSKIRPYLDAREVCAVYARIMSVPILLADALVRTEDEWMRREEKYATFDEEVVRFNFTTPLQVIQREPREINEKKYSILLPETKESIDRVLEQKGKVFLYAARRGIAPAVICYDCGYLFRSPESGAPYSLLRTYENGVEKRWFVCFASGDKVRAADVCPNCGGWRLKEYGIGIQQAETDVKELWPKTDVLVFDHTTAGTAHKAISLSKRFSETKGVIMIGTSMALPYLENTIDLAVITSYEAARSQKTWRSDEITLSLIYTLREKVSLSCIVQTNTSPDTLLKYAEKGFIEPLYTNEIHIREKLSYPPFSVFVLLTLEGTKSETNSLESMIDAHLPEHRIVYYNDPVSTKEKVTRYGLLRVPKADWPDLNLMNLLRTLPPSIKIEVNPDRIV